MKVILGLFWILTLTLGLESHPIIRSNEDYIQTGFSIIQPSYLKTSEQFDSIANATITFKQSIYNPSHFQLSLQDLNIKFGKKISFKISSSNFSSTKGLILINWGRNSSILRLKVRFIVIKNMSQIAIYPIFFSSFNQTGRNIPSVSYSWQSSFLLFNGLNIKNSNFSYFDIDFQLGRSSIKVTTSSNIQVQYESVHLILITYQKSQQLPILIIERFTLTLNNLAASYSNTNISMIQSNTFWGLKKFGMSLNQSQFSILSNFEAYKIDVWTNQPNRIIDYYGIIILFSQCGSQTPMYLQANNTCFDVCPFRYFQDLQKPKSCKKCSNYDCLRCFQDKAVQVCSQCSAELDFRILNNKTHRCDPMDGYYQEEGQNITIAKRCHQNCRTCDGISTKCTSCHKQFVLNGDSNKCESCPVTCLECTSKVVCTLCKTEYKLIKGQCNIQKTSNQKIVASAATSLILCCALVTIFVFHKHNKEWNKTNSEQQKIRATEENNNENQIKKGVSAIIQNQNSNLIVINNSKIENAEQSGYVFYQRNKRRRQ